MLLQRHKRFETLLYSIMYELIFSQKLFDNIPGGSGGGGGVGTGRFQNFQTESYSGGVGPYTIISTILKKNDSIMFLRRK